MGISGTMRNNVERGDSMERMVCVPVEQYFLMLRTYDELTEQVREMRRQLEGSRGTEEPDKEEDASCQKSKR